MAAASEVVSSDQEAAANAEPSTGAAGSIEGRERQTAWAARRRLPDVRRAVTHHFSIAGQEGYLTVGLYEDGMPGEIFIRMAKQGSTISGLMDSFGMVVSLALQHGVPLELLCAKFSHTRFEPSGCPGTPPSDTRPH